MQPLRFRPLRFRLLELRPFGILPLPKWALQLRALASKRLPMALQQPQQQDSLPKTKHLPHPHGPRWGFPALPRGWIRLHLPRWFRLVPRVFPPHRAGEPQDFQTLPGRPWILGVAPRQAERILRDGSPIWDRRGAVDSRWRQTDRFGHSVRQGSPWLPVPWVPHSTVCPRLSRKRWFQAPREQSHPLDCWR